MNNKSILPAVGRTLLGRRSWRFLTWVFLFTLLCSAIFHFLFLVYLHDFKQLIFPDLEAFFIGDREVLNDKERSLALEYLVDGGVVASVEDFLTGIYSFYQTVIGILIALLAMVSGFAYFSIKGVSAEKAEAVSKAKVEERLSSESFAEQVRTEVFTRIQNDNMGIGDVYDKINDLDDELKKLRKEISELRMDSSEGGNLILE